MPACEVPPRRQPALEGRLQLIAARARISDSEASRSFLRATLTACWRSVVTVPPNTPTTRRQGRRTGQGYKDRSARLTRVTLGVQGRFTRHPTEGVMRLAALTVALLSSVALVSPAQATFPGGNGLIAYYDYASSPEQIFAVEPDGSPVTQLTHGDRGSRDPHWSADGTTLALVKDPIASGRDRLATMNADGSNVTTLLSGVGQRRKTIYNPTFSPDGTRIAFCAFGSAPSAIYLINTDGSGLTKISRRHQPTATRHGLRTEPPSPS